MTGIPAPQADITVDGTGLLCVTLLLKLRARIADAAAGTIVHAIATDPAAPLGRFVQIIRSLVWLCR